MRITEVRAYPLTVLFEAIYGGIEKVPASLLRPASHFLRFPRRGQHATIVEIRTDTGLVGTGEAFGLPIPQLPAEAIRRFLAPALIGRDPAEVEAIHAEFLAFFRALGHSRGTLLEALSGIDIALWDLRARAEGRPLSRLLNGERRAIPLYVSPVPFLDTPEESAERARAFLAEGYHHVKLKVGRGVEVDLAHVAAVRAALGDGPMLMLDANCGYAVEEAIEAARGLAAHDVAWLEEPVAGDDLEGLAKIRQSSPVPIASGENEFTAAGVAAMLRAGAVDVVQPNILRIGGVTGSLAVARLCAEHGARFAPHGVGSGIGIAAMLQVCSAAPAFMIYEANRLQNPLRDELLVPPIVLEDGHFVVPDGPGLGATLDWNFAHRYLDS